MKKILLDALMLILFLLVMSFVFIPRQLHEVLGLVMPTAVVIHLIWNRRWFFNILRGSWNGRKIISTLINFAMLITLIVIVATGVCMSNFIFIDVIPMEIHRNMTLHQIHVSMPYILLMLIGLHIGLHWREILGRLHITIPTTFGYVITAGMFCAGLYGAILNRVGDRIMMLHIFATPATDLPFVIFVFLLIATMSIFTTIGWLISRR